MKVLLPLALVATVSTQEFIKASETSPCVGDAEKEALVTACVASLIKLQTAEDTAAACAILQNSFVKCIEDLKCMSQDMCDSLDRDSTVGSAVKECKTTCTATKSGCFPASSTVELESGKVKNLDQLEVGDKVRVGSNEFSEVYFFSTQLPESSTKFVKIVTDTAVLSLTSGHYLYANGELTLAEDVKVNDIVVLSNGTKANVKQVDSSWANGLYAPHTLNGDIVVDGVLVSTYTDAVHPQLAHALLSPLRTMYSAGISFGEKFSAGAKGLPSFLLKALA